MVNAIQINSYFSTPNQPAMRKRFLIKSSFAIGISLIFALLAVFAAQVGYADWLPEIQKPWFSLPQYIFSPVWVAMYVLLGIAAAMVWDRGFYHLWVKTALYHFGFILFLTGIWFLLLFALHRPFWALLDIILVLIITFITMRWFKIVRPFAAYLLVPYVVWICFAR